MLNFAVLRLVPVLGACVLGVALQGCAPKVDCNGDEVKKDVLAIVKEGLEKAAWYADVKVAMSGDAAITDVKTLAKNETIKQAQCSAQYTVTYNRKPRQVEVEYSVAFLEDKKQLEVLATADKTKLEIMKLAMSEAPIKNGTQEFFDPKTGKLVQSIQWKDNKKDGKQKLWTSDGQTVIADIDWINGKSNGWEKQPDSNGKILTDLKWKDGLQTGHETTLWGNGSLNELKTYVNGKLEGPHKVYALNPNGEGSYARIDETYKDGKLDGTQREYYDAKLEREVVYKDGQVVSDSRETGQLSAGGVAANNPSVDKCVDAKIAAFRKSQGPDAPINHDVLEEWTGECAK